MVNRNRLGPENEGPRTGRGMGPCREPISKTKEGGRLWKNKRESQQDGHYI